MKMHWLIRSLLLSLAEGMLLGMAMALYADHFGWSVFVGVGALSLSYMDGRNGWSSKPAEEGA